MNDVWTAVYVALGSNLRSPRERVLEALELLEAQSQFNCLQRSRLYLTRPFGKTDQPDFVNAAAGFLTHDSAREVLQTLLAIELRMGRDRLERWGPRVIDLDLVWMVDAITQEPGLTVPHPGVSMRNFVLYPLADIAPTLGIPGHGIVRELLRGVGDDGISVLE